MNTNRNSATALGVTSILTYVYHPRGRQDRFSKISTSTTTHRHLTGITLPGVSGPYVYTLDL